MPETVTFMAACRRFFGMKPGQTLTQFAEEVRGLTEEDRKELAPLMSEALGVTVTA